MAGYISEDNRKVTTHRLVEMKQRGEKISMLTAYDYTMAQIVDGAGMDVILVGDSASNVMAGNVTLARPLPLNVYCAGASRPESLQADTILVTSQKTAWLAQAGDARLLYGPEEIVLTVRPGRSATIEGAKETHAVQ